MAGKYQIVVEPEGRYADRPNDNGEAENRSCMVVRLTNGSYKQDVCRVGFARRNTKHPDTPFGDQLNKEIDKARQAVEILNEQLAPADGLL